MEYRNHTTVTSILWPPSNIFETEVNLTERLAEINPTNSSSLPGDLDPSCSITSSVEFSTALILQSLLLAIFNVLVVGGNLLVIASVFTCPKLRTITNTYVVSLAFADLLLGIFVLPFSSSLQVLGSWSFGSLWCYIWLAVDVWLCTASIYNLCVISLDRYLAITRPFRYQTTMSPLRAKLLVGVVWIIAFLICCPPLVGWNERGTSLTDPPTLQTDTSHSKNSASNGTGTEEMLYAYTKNHSTQFTSSQQNVTEPICAEPPTCSLNLESGYVVYSALGSFWIPVWIILFFYCRIYIIASRTTRGVRRGMLRTRSRATTTSQEGAVVLRIHRGGSSASANGSRPRDNSAASTSGTLAPALRRHSTLSSNRRSPGTPRCVSRSPSALTQTSSYGELGQLLPSTPPVTKRASLPTESPRDKALLKSRVSFSFTNGNKDALSVNGFSRQPHVSDLISNSIQEEGEIETSLTDLAISQHNNNGSLPHSENVLTRIGSRLNLKQKIRTFNREKKAAKTVGIIVGGFIVCWAPFFTVYLLTAFCADCTPEVLFTIFFWLGYCNSAVNPCVYALFSKDFRSAFRRLLCCGYKRRSRPVTNRRQGKFRTFMASLRLGISSSDENTVYEQ